MIHNIKKYLLPVVKSVHVVSALFLTLGALLPKKYLIYFIFGWPLLYLQWILNDNKCLLTQVEYWLANDPRPVPNYHYDFVISRTDPFFKFFNIKIDNELINFYCYFILIFCWLIGTYRYYI
jgi:hypothetical protein